MRNARRWLSLTALAGIGVLLGSATALFLLLFVDTSGSQARIAARTPQMVEGKEVVARMFIQQLTTDRRRYPVVYLQPLLRRASPPPGIRRWPRPGEAFVSPGLLEADPWSRRRFGHFAGVIETEGLAHGREWLVYAAPVSAAEKRLPYEEITGFGDTSGRLAPELGEQDISPPPALILVGASSASLLQLLYTALLLKLGPSGGTIGLWAGWAAGAGATALLVYSGVTVPMIDYAFIL